MPPSIRILLIYLLVVNVLSLAYFGFDKQRARAGGRRIRERTLHLLGLAGGFVGGLISMQLFRHKRRKKSFVTVYLLVSIVSAGLIYELSTLLTG